MRRHADDHVAVPSLARVDNEASKPHDRAATADAFTDDGALLRPVGNARAGVVDADLGR